MRPSSVYWHYQAQKEAEGERRGFVLVFPPLPFGYLLVALLAASAAFLIRADACCSQKLKRRPPESIWAYAAGSPQVSQRPTCVFTAFMIFPLFGVSMLWIDAYPVSLYKSTFMISQFHRPCSCGICACGCDWRTGQMLPGYGVLTHPFSGLRRACRKLVLCKIYAIFSMYRRLPGIREWLIGPLLMRV